MACLCLQYLGEWYEIEKLPAYFAIGECIRANYSMRGRWDCASTDLSGVKRTVSDEGLGHMLIQQGKIDL